MRLFGCFLVVALLACLLAPSTAIPSRPTVSELKAGFNDLFGTFGIDDVKASKFCMELGTTISLKLSFQDDDPSFGIMEEFWDWAFNEKSEKVDKFMKHAEKDGHKYCLPETLKYSMYSKNEGFIPFITPLLDASEKYLTGLLGNNFVSNTLNAVTFGVSKKVSSYLPNKGNIEDVTDFFLHLDGSPTRHHQVTQRFVEAKADSKRGHYPGLLFKGFDKWANGYDDHNVRFFVETLARRPRSMCEYISKVEGEDWTPIMNALNHLKPETMILLIEDYGEQAWSGKMFREIILAQVNNDLKGLEYMGYFMTAMKSVVKKAKVLKHLAPFFKFYGECIKIIHTLASKIASEGIYACAALERAIPESVDGFPGCVKVLSAIEQSRNNRCSSKQKRNNRLFYSTI